MKDDVRVTLPVTVHVQDRRSLIRSYKAAVKNTPSEQRAFRSIEGLLSAMKSYQGLLGRGH